MRKVVAIIQARIGSSRLPGKVLLPIEGKPMLQHVVERANAIKGVNQVCLAVPHADFFTFAPLAEKWGIKTYAGSGNDVLARYAKVAELTGADVVLRITGDCPLLAPEVCAAVLREVTSGSCEYATNDTRISGFPDGLDCQVMTRAVLELADSAATDNDDREHVCPWIERVGRVPMTIFETLQSHKRPWPKLSVDTQNDLDRVRRIMARIQAGDYTWAATQKAIEGLDPC